MDGINRKIEPGDSFSENVYHFSRDERSKRGIDVLPGNLGEAVEAFSSDKLVSEALGDYIANNLMELKRCEFEEYMSFTGNEWSKSLPEITSWEIERYLTRS